MILPESVQKLIKLFSEFPGIGPKQAARFVFFLLETNRNYHSEIAKSIQTLQSIRPCISCNLPSEKEYCTLCTNIQRRQTQICIVEKISDVLGLERTHAYHGTYYILGTNLLKEKKLNLIPLKRRLSTLQAKYPQESIEIILATNPTTEGEATALFLEKELMGKSIIISRLARGIPSGAELEYIDQTTLQGALENRKNVQ